MKLLLASSALAAALAVAPAFAQQTSQPPAASSANQGAVTVEGVEPSKVLGSIDTSKLVDQPSPPAGQQLAQLGPKKVTKSTEVHGTKATGTTVTTTEVIKPAVAPKQFPSGSEIAPEVQAAYDAGHRSTKDVIAAQLAAVQNAPIPQPTTVITTKVTTPAQPADSNG